MGQVASFGLMKLIVARLRNATIDGTPPGLLLGMLRLLLIRLIIAFLTRMLNDGVGF